jgi:hypothetical protein
MGWLDNLWRRQSPATDDKQQAVEAHKAQSESEPSLPDELEEEAHENRDEQIMREPRIPPGTG